MKEPTFQAIKRNWESRHWPKMSDRLVKAEREKKPKRESKKQAT